MLDNKEVRGNNEGEVMKNRKKVGTKTQRWNSLKIVIVPYLSSALMIIGMTLVFSLINPLLGLVNISLLYLIPILISAARWGTLPAISTALMGTVAFDLFFVPPFFKFIVADLRYLISFAIFMLVGLITGTLSDRLKKQVNYSRQRENSISALYSLSRDIAAVDNLEAVLDCIVSNVSKTVEGQVMLLLPNDQAQLVLRKDSGLNNSLDKRELSVAAWAYETGLKAGHGTETFGTTKALYSFLDSSGRTRFYDLCYPVCHDLRKENHP